MALVRRRVVNPAPAILALVNGSRKKRGRNMATRKTKRRGTRRASARRNPVNPVNPVNPSRRRKSTRRGGRRSAVYARRRNPIINPTRRRGRRRFSRRRNPTGGLIGRAVPLVISSGLIAMAAPPVAQLVARFAPQIASTPVGVAATTFGTGWLLSMLAGAFAFTRRWKDDVLLAGAVLAGGQLFTAYVRPMIPFGNGMGRRYGMRGIAAVHGVPPHILPPAPPPQANGVRGIAPVATGWGR